MSPSRRRCAWHHPYPYALTSCPHHVPHLTFKYCDAPPPLHSLSHSHSHSHSPLLTPLPFPLSPPFTSLYLYTHTQAFFNEMNEKNRFPDVVQLHKGQAVSSDFIGFPASSVVDYHGTFQLTDSGIKFSLWYDNEWSYCAQMIHMARTMNEVYTAPPPHRPTPHRTTPPLRCYATISSPHSNLIPQSYSTRLHLNPPPLPVPSPLRPPLSGERPPARAFYPRRFLRGQGRLHAR